MKTFLSFKRRWREARMFARAMASTDHPILAQIIPIRRCNLACTYCNEFDKDSRPVPTSDMLRRIDKLGALGTSIITFSGGEPTLHPDLDLLIRRVRKQGAIAFAAHCHDRCPPHKLSPEVESGVLGFDINLTDHNMRPELITCPPVSIFC
jgi:sulfatase maturation enzyme AslB (radical SAM superfamily)